MENLKHEISTLETKVINALYYALIKYQDKYDKEYFVIGADNIGVKYFDSLNGLCIIPVGSICADYDGNVRYCGKEDWTLPDFYHAMFDYEDVDHYKIQRSGNMILSDIYTLYELINSKL